MDPHLASNRPLSATRRRRCGCIALLTGIDVHVDDANTAGLEHVHALRDRCAQTVDRQTVRVHPGPDRTRTRGGEVKRLIVGPILPFN